jgi:hypothetical protein
MGWNSAPLLNGISVKSDGIRKRLELNNLFVAEKKKEKKPEWVMIV